MEDFMRPVWAGGWTLTRYLWCAAATIMLVPRARGISDVYGASDFVVPHHLYNLNSYLFVTPAIAWSAWGAGLVGIGMVLYGRRTLRPGLLVWFVGNWTLLMSEALNIKAYDRLFLWISLALLVSPAAETNLTKKLRQPVGRYTMLIVYCAIYGSTGIIKLTHGGSWIGDGSALAYAMVDLNHGGRWLGTWLSGQGWLVAPLAWATVAFEVGFPFLIWFRKVNPWLLLIGASFHLGIMLALRVGPFFWVAISGYPVLLHPDVAQALYRRLRGERPPLIKPA